MNAQPPAAHRNGHDTRDHLLEGTALETCFACHRAVSHDEYLQIQIDDRERIEKLENEIAARFLRERDAEIAEIERAADVRVEKANQDATKREAAIRKESAAAATKAVKESFEAKLKQQSEAQAEAFAKMLNAAVATEREKAFADKMKVEQQLKDALRANDRKTANELGDEGEIDLWETLVAEFPADQIARVPKGVNGPDIVQRIFVNGVCVGANVFEVKNHKRFQQPWIAKLRQDVIEADASHGILVTTAFPPGEHQLIVRDGMIVAAPARAVVIAHVLRRAVVQFHALKLSNADRDEKTARLYALMTSDRVADRWNRIAQAAADLLEIEKVDAAHQEKTRGRRTTLIRAVEVTHDEFVGEIDQIISGVEASS